MTVDKMSLVEMTFGKMSWHLFLLLSDIKSQLKLESRAMGKGGRDIPKNS